MSNRSLAVSIVSVLLLQASFANAVVIHSVQYDPSTSAGVSESLFFDDRSFIGQGVFGYTDVLLSPSLVVTEFHWWGSSPDWFSTGGRLVGFRLNIWSHDPNTVRPFAGYPDVAPLEPPASGSPSGWLYEQDIHETSSSLLYELITDDVSKYSVTLANPFVAPTTGTYWFSLAEIREPVGDPQWSWAMGNTVESDPDWRGSWDPEYRPEIEHWSNTSADLASVVVAAPVPEPTTLLLTTLGWTCSKEALAFEA